MRWLRSWLGGLSLASIMLLVLSVYIVALGLANVAAGVERSLFTSMGLLAVLVGLAVSSQAATSRRAFGISAGMGMLVILLRVGGIGPRLIAVVREWAFYFGLTRSPWFRQIAGTDVDERLKVAGAELSGAVGVLLARTGAWLRTWSAGEPTFDPVAAALLWSVLLWLTVSWAAIGYRVRRQPLVALIPMIVLLGAALGGVGAKPGALIWSLGILIPSLVLVAQDVREVRWKRLMIASSPSLRRNLILWAAFLAIGLMLAAGLSQQITYRRVVQTVEGIMNARSRGDELALQALGLERSEEAEPRDQTDIERLRYAGLPRRHLIGSGPELSEQLRLSIRVLEEAALRGLEPGGPSAPYYWRSNTYDVYLGGGWMTSGTDHLQLAPGEVLRAEIPAESRTVEQVVRSVPELGGLLFSAGSLVTVDQPYAVDLRSPEDDFGSVLIKPSTTSRLISYVPQATPDQLRASGTDYPQWVTARYLQLRNSVPDRVIALSRELTATSPTAYDRAIAIEEYLRGYEYSLDIDAPPRGRDIVDYFLFDLQKGYCDYYASSMVVLARAAGLPARLVVGYHTGTYNVQLNSYLVTEAEAHSWPEIYFPQYGWIEFEPTAGRPALSRDESRPYAPPLDMEIPPELRAGEPAVELSNWIYAGLKILLALLLVVISAMLVRTLVRSIQARRLSPSGAIARVFGEFRSQSRALGLLTTSGMTPDELRNAFGAAIAEYPQDRVLVPAAEEVNQLVRAYERASYSTTVLDKNGQAEIRRVWRRLRWRLGWMRLASKILGDGLG